jgi:aminoglycoside phosphotransferase (APT) family kinase protein
MERAEVTSDQASTFLEERYEGHATALEPLHGGEWSRAFGFVCDGQELVVRFGRYPEDYEADLAAVAYSSPELPVPAVFEIGQAFGGAYAISERRHGVPLETLSAEAWKRVLPSLWQGLDRLRSVQTSGAGEDWRDFLLSQFDDVPGTRVSGWSADLAADSQLSELFRTGRQLLEPLLWQCPSDTHVVHNDLLHGNVLAAPDGSELRAVFDWGTALEADFLYEIATLGFFAAWFPNMSELDLVAEAARHYHSIGLEVPDYERRVATYMLHIGLLHVVFGVFAHRPRTETEWIAARCQMVIETLAQAGV